MSDIGSGLDSIDLGSLPDLSSGLTMPSLPDLGYGSSSGQDWLSSLDQLAQTGGSLYREFSGSSNQAPYDPTSPDGTGVYNQPAQYNESTPAVSNQVPVPAPPATPAAPFTMQDLITPSSPWFLVTIGGGVLALALIMSAMSSPRSGRR